MITYNDVVNLSQLYENNKYNECVDFTYTNLNCNNILDFLIRLKKLKFTGKESSIKLLYKDKDVIIFEDDFLTNIPEEKTLYKTIESYKVKISHPKIISGNISKLYCIHSLEMENDIFEFNTIADYNLLPLDVAAECDNEIKSIYHSFENCYLYYVNEEYNSRFLCENESILRTLNYALIDSYENLLKEQIFLMEKFNFSYTDFDSLDIQKARNFINIGVKILNERNRQKTEAIE